MFVRKKKNRSGTVSVSELMQISPQELYIHQRLTDQYSYSKFLAEREILQRVVDGGLMANIIRVGYLAPRSKDGKLPYNISENMLSSLLQVMMELGGCPESSSHMEMAWAPVDDVADGIFNVAASCPTQPVLHVEGMRRCSIKKLADIYAGRELPLWSDDYFLKRLSNQHKSGVGTHLLEMMMNN